MFSAQFALAVRYEHAEGVPRDYAHALELYCAAAGQGHADASFSIAWIYLNGRGVARSDTNGAAWLRLAAARSALSSSNGRRHRLQDLELLSPLDPPRGNVIAIGRNYQKHAEETARKEGREPNPPTIFTNVNPKARIACEEIFGPVLGVLKARLWDLEEAKRQAELSKNRRSQVQTGDRSEKIRTYNFPQDRVTDHRIGFTRHNLPGVMNGDIDEFLENLIAVDQADKLQNMFQ